VVVADNAEIARHDRVFDRYITRYDWQHYIALIAQKPGALRNGAPFQTMPEPLLHLQRHLLKHPGGDRVMAQVLSAIPVHGIDSVLGAVNSALESGRPSGEHVLNVLGRIKQAPAAESITTALTLKEEPQANVSRYERLRSLDKEIHHVA
jgi:hypothetical protein